MPPALNSTTWRWSRSSSEWGRVLRHSLAEEPYPHKGQELLGVDRFRDVVRGACFQTLLAVALHGFRSERQYRQRAEHGIIADFTHCLVAVHFGHHDFHQNHAQI